uniref:Ribosomal protein S6 n=1 Tax=Cryptomonas sp. SAG 977-2f TaxID=279061 RepID=A0A679CA60_9CRYP|nr:ribosomal protein S6 [Cryptomonas sp. SAG 977-2f]
MNVKNLSVVSYETVYLIKPDVSEEQLFKIIEHYQDMLMERGAKNIIVQNRGRRNLKYPIKKIKDSIYIQMNYDANGESVRLFEHSMKISEHVVRYLTVRCF